LGVADIVEQLQRGEPLVRTTASCSGHKSGQFAHVLLEDGRVLVVLPGPADLELIEELLRVLPAGLDDPTPEVDPVVMAALAHAKSRGFLGLVAETSCFGDDAHALWLVQCFFPDSTTSLYVVAADVHDSGAPPAMLSLTSAVHVLQNVTEDERWALEGRNP
jgi:hypothetical protein